MDLSRAAALLALALVAPSLAHAQPLMPNPGLTSLLQPQQLDRSRPLISPDRSAGTQSGLQQNRFQGRAATPCDRGGTAPTAGSAPAAPAGPSLFGSGSGPGTYGRYIPGAAPSADPAAKTPATATPQPGAARTPAADRPLYGGTDRPLWDTGERRAAAPTTGSAPGRVASAGAAGQTANGQNAKSPTGTDAAGTASASATPLQPNALPAPVRDRPLWAEGSLSGSPNPVTAPLNGPGREAAPASSVGGGVAANPCPAAPLPR